MYSFNGTGTTQIGAKLVPADSTGLNVQAGNSVALDAVGDTVVFGAPYDQYALGK